MARVSLNIFRFVVWAALAGLTASCFVTEGLTDAKDKPKTVAPPAPAQSPPIVEPPQPDPLPPPKLARRLALDLLNRFPARADIDTLAADAAAFPRLVDSYLATAEASRALSELHPRMWRFRASVLPGLERLVADDAALGTALTTALRTEMLREPALAVRLLLDRDEPFSVLFTAPYAVMHPDVASLYGIAATGVPWASEPYVFADYGDDRPAAGILNGNGVLAAFDGKDDPALKGRTARLLTTFGCYRTEAVAAHTMYELTDAELQGDLTALAATRKPCVGCHAQFHDAAAAFSGLGEGATFAAWRQYVVPSGQAPGRLASLPFSGLAELGAVVGADSRTHRCELERLAIELYQRRAGARDQTTLADALTFFQDAGQRLKPGVKHILTSKEYKFGPVPPTFKAAQALESSGVRMLKRSQWLGILRELSYAAGGLEIPEALEAGAGEMATDLDHVPAGTYFHYADRLARQAATAIVDEELQPGTTAATRRVLTTLPDGTGQDASAEQVKAQLRTTWELLTTEVLDDANPTYLDLQTLWAAAASDGTPDDVKRAWRVVLVAMLTHPAFLTY